MAWAFGLAALSTIAKSGLTAGYDYEWGRQNARQHTVSLMAEKMFVGTPHSIALQVDRVQKWRPGHHPQ